ncbi:MAG: biotin transporter BioY [Lachnospiraceae bacterium]|nr:biotin transporter BioY [Lachnospiraceae bacterium]
MRSGSKIQQMTYIALMAVIIAICSWITIPGPVPFTLQTFAVFTTLLLLGARDSLLSILIYLLLGAVGVPVFSGFSGGIGHLLGPTGGYLIGFLVMGLVYAVIEHFTKASVIRNVLASAVGMLFCYAFGTMWFVIVYSRNTPISFGAALSMCVLPFIIPDAVKMALAILLSERVRKLVPTLKKQ